MKNLLQTIKLVFFIWVAFGVVQLQAQDKHFIYIQNESKQPFYVQLNKEVYSSTPGGFLIIPQLTVGKYDLATGFAKNQYPEQKFIVDLNKDAGFSLKQYGDKGWGLFDLENFTTIMASAKDTVATSNVQTTTVLDSSSNKKEVVSVEASKKDSSLVHDSAAIVASGNTSTSNLPTTIEAKKDSVKTVVPDKTVTSEAKKDSVTKAVPDETVSAEVKKDPVTTAEPEKETEQVVEKVQPAKVISSSIRSTSIVKTFQKVGSRGFDLIYVDKSSRKHDTIALFIPRGEKIVKASAAPLKTKEPIIKTGNTKVVNCILATDEDFYKTRMNLAIATTENAMMIVARTAFKSKCFSTKQVKYLGVLFLSEESRLHFLELAKPYVYDAGNFSSLQSQFTEPEMKQKFRALLKK